MGDGTLALAAAAFEVACLMTFALLLRLPCSSDRRWRAIFGASVSLCLLGLQPYIYRTPTQMWGMHLACFSCLAAWSILFWTFLAPLDSKPPVLDVVLSSFSHSFQGVIKAHKRRSASTPPERKVEDKAAAQQQQQQQLTNTELCRLLVDTAAGLAVACVVSDVGLYGLCTLTEIFGEEMCKGNVTPLVASQQQPSYLALCVFAFPAGMLLTQQIEVIYSCVRLHVILGAFKWQGLSQFAAHMPQRAFNWPLAARSVSELWGERWHQLLRFYFETLGAAATDAVMPQGKPAPASRKSLRAVLRCITVFAMSSALHDYMIWAAFDGRLGWHTLFFMLNGVAVLLENWAPVLLSVAVKMCRPAGPVVMDGEYEVTAQVSPQLECQAAKSGGARPAHKAFTMPIWLKHVWVLSVFFVLGPLFVEPVRAAGFWNERAFLPFGSHMTPVVVNAIQQLCY